MCDNERTVQFTMISCVINVKKNLVGIGWGTDGMYSVHFKNVEINKLLLPWKEMLAF